MKDKIKIAILIFIAVFFLYRAYRIYFYTPDIDFSSLKLKDLSGKEVALNISDLDKTMVVCFQTWCSPCVAEMQLVQKHFEKFKFLTIYFITDESEVKVESLKRRLKLDSLNFLISVEPLSELGIESFPTIFILKDGQIIEKHKGAIVDESNLEDEIFHLNEMLKN
ncbi:MAG: hypothetical protein KatS3mg027_0651 [Bacteroidia bacterium]|nr:MAG: hypothetical protein KatS3mg027_0651 [Bacteroidia bacterium]